MRKFWSVTNSVGLHPSSWLSYVLPDTVTNFPVSRNPGVEGYVALTIDDGLCRQGREHSLIAEVQQRLKKHEAQATFFLCSDYVKGFEQEALQLLKDGHEFANHCPADRGDYWNLSSEKFEEELLKTSHDLEALLHKAQCQTETLRWFRAPQAKYTRTMHEVVRRQGLRHALADCYCDDFANEDPRWIAKTLSSQASSGSIIILHMPEKGHWEWTLEALDLLLQRLKRKQLRAVSLSRLEELATGPRAAEREAPADKLEEGDIADVPSRAGLFGWMHGLCVGGRPASIH